MVYSISKKKIVSLYPVCVYNQVHKTEVKMNTALSVGVDFTAEKKLLVSSTIRTCEAS